jgi:hypothetical protein
VQGDWSAECGCRACGCGVWVCVFGSKGGSDRAGSFSTEDQGIGGAEASSDDDPGDAGSTKCGGTGASGGSAVGRPVRRLRAAAIVGEPVKKTGKAVTKGVQDVGRTIRKVVPF